MALHHAYIPEIFDHLYGNDALKKSLKSVLSRRDEDIPRAYLFHGPSGCGKNALADILYSELGINTLRYYDTATTRGIDTIRGIRELLAYGGKEMFVLDECHQITGAAAEALLNALLDTPSGKYFVLCTSEPAKIKPTIKRRCYKAELKPLTTTTMERYLTDILTSENKEIDDRVRDRVVKFSDGSPGIALNMLDSIMDMEDVDKAIEVVEMWSEEPTEALELCQAVMHQRWADVKRFLIRTKMDPTTLQRAIVGYLNSVLLRSKDYQKSLRVSEQMAALFEYDPSQQKPGLTLACFVACNTDEPDDIPF